MKGRQASSLDESSCIMDQVGLDGLTTDPHCAALLNQPHKPLLLLLALAKCARGEPRWISFQEVDSTLGKLLQEFGPPRKSTHPEYPFWRLQNDKLWCLDKTEGLESAKARPTPRSPSCSGTNVSGGLRLPMYRALRKDPALPGCMAEPASLPARISAYDTFSTMKLPGGDNSIIDREKLAGY